MSLPGDYNRLLNGGHKYCNEYNIQEMKTRLGWVECEQRWLIISYQFKVLRQTGRCMDMCMYLSQEKDWEEGRHSTTNRSPSLIK